MSSSKFLVPRLPQKITAFVIAAILVAAQRPIEQAVVMFLSLGRSVMP